MNTKNYRVRLSPISCNTSLKYPVWTQMLLSNLDEERAEFEKLKRATFYFLLSFEMGQKMERALVGDDHLILLLLLYVLFSISTLLQ